VYIAINGESISASVLSTSRSLSAY